MKLQTAGYQILGNSIFENLGLGIDVDMDNAIMNGVPEVTASTNLAGSARVTGKYKPNLTFRLELFGSDTCNPSGYGEGKTLIHSGNVTTDAGGVWSVTLSRTFAPGVYLTATAEGITEFSKCYFITVPGRTNSWTPNSGGKWEVGANWSLGVPPFSGLETTLITNAGNKTIVADATTARDFPTTLVLSNLLIRAPSGSQNTLRLDGLGGDPLRIRSDLTLDPGGELVVRNSSVWLEGSAINGLRSDGRIILDNGALEAPDFNKAVVIGSARRASLLASNSTLLVGRCIVGAAAGSDGMFIMSGGTATFTSAFDLADDLMATGTVVVAGGVIDLSNIYVGLFGQARLSVSDGLLRCAGTVDIASQPGSRGLFEATGGTSVMGSIIIVESPGAIGTMRMSGSAQVECQGELANNGTLTLDGGTLTVGNLTLGAMSQLQLNGGTLRGSNTTSRTGQPITLGGGPAPATLSLQRGTHSFPDGLEVNANGILTGEGSLLGSVTSRGVIAPGNGLGRLDLSNTLTLTSSSELRFELGGYQQATQYDFVRVVGAVTLGGRLTVTFANGFDSVVTNGATFRILTAGSFSGTFANVASGSRLATADGKGDFLVTYTAGNLFLSDYRKNLNIDTDGDVMPDTYEMANGFDKNDPSDATRDTDNDGATNIAEFHAGTNPRDPNSGLRILSIRRESNNLRITWRAGGGRTNQLQVASTLATNRFTDLGAPIVLPGAGDVVTNQLDAGAALLGTNRFYRVKLIP